MSNSRSPLGGELISKKDAYKGLGNPKTWDTEAKKLMLEFKKKPVKQASPVRVIRRILSTAKKIPRTVGGFIKPHGLPEQAFAKSGPVRRKQKTRPRGRTAKPLPKVRVKAKKKRRD